MFSQKKVLFWRLTVATALSSERCGWASKRPRTWKSCRGCRRRARDLRRSDTLSSRRTCNTQACRSGFTWNERIVSERIMAKFSIEHPYLIVVICLLACVRGVTSLGRMAVDLFPPINIPVVMCATFYNGMPPTQIEADITDTFERFFMIGSNIDYMTSRSLAGVSLIEVHFAPGSHANADITQISNLALADLKRLPEGTLPPVVLGMG